ncbi:MAG: TolC family protein [Planctomycetes bacterium]|nr:TolC family protein [Planctomycetota bacterium]
MYLRSLFLAQFIFFGACLFTLCLEYGHADEGKELLQQLLVTHPTIMKAQADERAAYHDLKAQIGDYFPELNLSAYEKHQNQSASPVLDDRHYRSHAFSVSIKQLIWDFGATRSKVKQNWLQHRQSLLIKEDAMQSTLLKGLSEIIKIRTLAYMLQYSRESVKNLQRQTELESIRVAKGQGYSTDVLQAQTQLLGAQSRQVGYEGDLRQALGAYKALFGEIFQGAEKLLSADQLSTASLVFSSKLFAGLEGSALELEGASESGSSEFAQAKKLALAANLKIELKKIEQQASQLSTKSARQKGFGPNISTIAQGSWGSHLSSYNNYEQDRSIRVELNFPFKMAGTAFRKISAAKQREASALHALNESKREVENEIEKWWHAYESAQKTYALFSKQIKVAEEFLVNAEKERAMGRRSLLDILNGEQALISAKSQQEQSLNKALMAKYSLLYVMSRLKLDRL